MTSNAWIPVAPAAVLRPAANIVAAFFASQELALWRSQAGLVQAWDNRCPHRGMRFTLGRILDGKLSCAYHGWQFDTDGGQCSAIPAHPGVPAPKNVCATTFSALEAQGMIWVAAPALDGQNLPGAAMPVGNPTGQFCRTLAVQRGTAHTTQVLASQGFITQAPHTVTARLAQHEVTIYVNDVSPHSTFLHVWMPSGLSASAIQGLLAGLQSLRTAIETAARE
jgi:nitrite reductase/ring-hydroxylating ferredoxin subunit